MGYVTSRVPIFFSMEVGYNYNHECNSGRGKQSTEPHSMFLIDVNFICKRASVFICALCLLVYLMWIKEQRLNNNNNTMVSVHIISNYEYNKFDEKIDKVQRERQMHVEEECQRLLESDNSSQLTAKQMYRRFLVDDERKFIYCWVPKVSSYYFIKKRVHLLQVRNVFLLWRSCPRVDIH